MTPHRDRPERWQLVKFAELAENINERVDDPSSSGLEHYVGLDHLDPGTLKIRRWGSPSDVESTKLRFYPGDVIYARRRAYQRKLGVAEWDGIASAHSLVLRARPNVCLPQFLPYFLQSDQFHQRALDISVGSLSPTINWKTLAVQEFIIPPVEEQHAFVGLLRVATEAVSSSAAAHDSADEHLRSLSLRFVKDPATLVGTSVALDEVPLGTLCEIKRGRFSHRPRNEPRLYSDGGSHPFVQTGDIQNAERHIADFSQFLSDEGVTYSRCVPGGTLLVTIAAVIGALAYTTTSTYLPDSVVSVVPEPDVEQRYLEFLLRGLRPLLETRVATENTPEEPERQTTQFGSCADGFTRDAAMDRGAHGFLVGSSPSVRFEYAPSSISRGELAGTPSWRW